MKEVFKMLSGWVKRIINKFILRKSMGLEKIKELNLKQIKFLSEKFGIDVSNGSFKIKKDFSGQDILDSINFLKTEIWNSQNIAEVIDIIKNQKEGEIMYYWPPEENEPIDGFLERAGILDFKVAIDDPLSWLCGINPNWDDCPDNEPELYLRYLFENSLFLISLSKWIETGQLIMLPHLGLWDPTALFELGHINEAIHKDHNLDNTEVGKELYKYGAFEAGVSSLPEMMRLMQKNFTVENIKKSINGIDDDTALKVLNHFKSLPKEERDEQAIYIVAEMFNIEDEYVKERIERFKKQSLFHIENYFDISDIRGSISMRHSMPMIQALHIADKLNVIPITDYKLNKLTFDLFEQVLNLNNDYKNQKELVESKIEFEAPFISGLSPEFIMKQKKTGKAKELKVFLSKKWNKIRESKNSKEYVNALSDFSDEVNFDFKGLLDNFGQIKREAIEDSLQVLAKTTGEFAGSAVESGVFMAVAKSIPVLFSGGIGAYKIYDSKKYELKKNPLFIFLEKNKNS
ncbi:MAG: hypothetical protein KBC12_03720 [Candidatus Pacebacteria bacterium]|nr:hypothetical protein [Candidatus Paceibacterota bacterium]